MAKKRKIALLKIPWNPHKILTVDNLLSTLSMEELFFIFENEKKTLVLYCKYCNLSRIVIKAHLDANLEFQ